MQHDPELYNKWAPVLQDASMRAQWAPPQDVDEKQDRWIRSNTWWELEDWKWDVQQHRWMPKTYNMRQNEPLRASGRHGARGGKNRGFYAELYGRGKQS